MKQNKKDIVINNSNPISLDLNKILTTLTYIIIDTDKRIIGISPLFGELIGAADTDVTGKEVTVSVPVEKDARKRFTEFIDSLIADTSGRTGEFVIETPDGFRTRQVMVAFPLREEKPVTHYIILSFHESLSSTHLVSNREKEAEFRALIDQIPIGVCIHIDRKFVYVNKAGLRLFKAEDFDELKGRNIFDFVHPDFHKPIEKRVEYIDSLHGEVPFVEEKFLTVNKEVFDVEAFGSSINYLGKQAVIVFCRGIGAQKSIERRLAESEQKYQSLFDVMLSGFAYHRMIYNEKGEAVDCEFLEANPAYLQMMGLTGKEIIGKRAGEVFPGTYESLIGKFTEVIASGNTARFEWFFIEQNKYFEISAYSREKDYFATIFRDISARRNFETTLKNERDLFNQIVEISPVGLLVLDKNGKMVFINRTVKALAGMDVENEREIPKHCPVMRFAYTGGSTVPDSDLPNAIVQRTKKYIRNMTYLVEFSSGIKKYISVNGAPVMGPDGEVDKVVLSLQDITDSTRMELALEQLIRVSALTGQEFFNAMVLGFAKTFELDYVMICVLDETSPGHATTIALCKQDTLVENIEYGLSGTPCESINGNKFCVYRDGVRKVFPDAPLLKAMEIEGYGGMPLYSSKGRQLGLLSVMSLEPFGDVALIEKFASLFAARISSEIERLQMEEERVKMEEQLRHSQKMETIGRLAGGIAHDFNNMLTPIIGYADMILRFDLEPGTSVYESMEELYEAAIRAKNLTRQLLAFGRKQMLILKTVDLNEVISNFFNIIRRTIRENIHMQFEPNPGLWSIEADVSQIEQIILNLCVNSQDAMLKGGDLKIVTRNVTIDEPRNIDNEMMNPGNYTVMTISDTGSGIDDEYLAHIFEPFFTTKREMGTGLGLATVYGIVRQHQGYIAVHSRKGIGTEFDIYFPKTEKAVSTGQKPGIPNSGQPEDEAGEITILLVEDDPSVRSLTETILKKYRYRVISVSDAKNANLAFDSFDGKIDLLLTDVVMPDINGQDLFYQLRETNPELKVLFMSGYTGNHLDIQGFKFDEEQYIQKPFSMNQLIEKIRGII